MPKPTSARSHDHALLESLWRDPVERYMLPNGLTVLRKCDPAAPVSSVQVWEKTGSIHGGWALGAGLSHYVVHMLVQVAQHRARRQRASGDQAHGVHPT